MQSLLEVLAGTLLEEEDMRLDAGRGGVRRQGGVTSRVTELAIRELRSASSSS